MRIYLLLDVVQLLPDRVAHLLRHADDVCVQVHRALSARIKLVAFRWQQWAPKMHTRNEDIFIAIAKQWARRTGCYIDHENIEIQQCPRLIGTCLDLASATKGRILAAFVRSCGTNVHSVLWAPTNDSWCMPVAAIAHLCHAKARLLRFSLPYCKQESSQCA